jgi:hypothetical protein
LIQEKYTIQHQSCSEDHPKASAISNTKSARISRDYQPIMPAKRERRNAFEDLRKINNFIEVMPMASKDFLPCWIRDRSDFLGIYYGNQIKERLDIPKICSKCTSKRTNQETSTLLDWLKGLKTLEN